MKTAEILERAREIIIGDITRKRRTIKLETSARGGGTNNVPDQSWAVKTTSENSCDDDLWGTLFQPAEEPSPAISPDVALKTTDTATPRSKTASPGYDPHAATMREEDLEALRRFNENKRQQREMKKKEEQRRIAMYATKVPKEEKMGTKEEQRIAAEEEKRRKREEAIRQRQERQGSQSGPTATTGNFEIPGFPVLCRKVGRGKNGERKAYASPIYT